MTRETKIGLLVGLAFIIVIGILLSDHLTSTTEPPQAPLVQAGESVRTGVATPGMPEAQPQQVVVQQGMTPQQPVPTRQEITPPPAQPPVQIVHIGPGGAPQQPQQPVVISHQQQHQSDTAQPPTQVAAANDEPIITRVPELPANGDASLVEVANQAGEPLVGAGVEQLAASQQVPAQQNGQQVREYKAEPGDNLSRIAAKTMGANTKANRDAIVKANPSLRDDPNKIIAGKTYVIPAAAAVASEAPVAPAETVAQVPPTRTPSSSPEYWYTTKEGDSLWRIAAEQLGDGNAYAAIKELNKDTLKGSDVVRPNMKLRLPARPVASAN